MTNDQFPMTNDDGRLWGLVCGVLEPQREPRKDRLPAGSCNWQGSGSREDGLRPRAGRVGIIP